MSTKYTPKCVHIGCKEDADNRLDLLCEKHLNSSGDLYHEYQDNERARYS